jgi:hypothetical protein
VCGLQDIEFRRLRILVLRGYVLSFFSLSFLGEREVDSGQPHDAFDLTDNDIQILGNFPLSPRLRTLLLARNRIATIQASMPSSVPNLRNLVLASNVISELADLDVLGRFGRLTHLVLVDNPVTKKEVGFSSLNMGGGC